ncbi:MAG: hypothetical protein K2M94_05960 [Paramuribaculum sp.]|nr:hypothetical protein [Paramuribaculum sp.]
MTRYDFRETQDFLQEIPAEELHSDVCGAMIMLDRITGKRNKKVTAEIFGILAMCADLLASITPKEKGGRREVA